MRGWKIKFIFLLFVYFAGFASAIYYLTPAPDEQAVSQTTESLSQTEEDTPQSAIRSDQFALAVSAGIHKCVDVAKDATKNMVKFIKARIDAKYGNEGK